jgi:hypothetical protein
MRVTDDREVDGNVLALVNRHFSRRSDTIWCSNTVLIYDPLTDFPNGTIFGWAGGWWL